MGAGRSAPEVGSGRDFAGSVGEGVDVVSFPMGGRTRGICGIENVLEQRDGDRCRWLYIGMDGFKGCYRESWE